MYIKFFKFKTLKALHKILCVCCHLFIYLSISLSIYLSIYVYATVFSFAGQVSVGRLNILLANRAKLASCCFTQRQGSGQSLLSDTGWQMEEVTANTIQEFFVCDNFMSETEKPAIVFL